MNDASIEANHVAMGNPDCWNFCGENITGLSDLAVYFPMKHHAALLSGCIEEGYPVRSNTSLFCSAFTRIQCGKINSSVKMQESKQISTRKPDFREQIQQINSLHWIICLGGYINI